MTRQLGPTPFLAQLQELLSADVAGMPAQRKADVLRAAASALEDAGAPVRCAFVPFAPGRRPTDEAAHPGLGSSERVAVILPGDERDPACLLYTVSTPAEMRSTVSFTGPDGSLAPVPVPSWVDRPTAPESFVAGERGTPVLEPVEQLSRRLVVSLCPADDLLPGAWAWDELDGAIRDAATDGQDPFTFGHLFCQQVRVELQARRGGVPVAASEASLFVYDLRRCGSLYARLLERLVTADVERQSGGRAIDAAYHPWFPVLRIGSDKARLYMQALVQDIAADGRHLADPGWLMRVGLYLEFLTFLGIVEAVRDDVGDLLTPAERDAFDHSDLFAELRARVNPAGWRDVWNQREIAVARRGTPRTGPVSAWNLIAKKRATLAFLHVHHDDLKHAIDLAGPNLHNSQETWQRVFRDAERAVLRNIPAAFPELDHLSEPARDFVLWHRKGRFELGRTMRVPPAISGLFADQDGLFASACNQYRASMNEVADWAKARDLMDHTGIESVPRQVSLLEAHLHQPARVALLQRRDGYGPALDVGAAVPESFQRPAVELLSLLAQAAPFDSLDGPDQASVARAARPLTLGPTERLVIQGMPSTGSLFLLAEGGLEVVVRHDDGRDVVVDTMRKGDVIGEMSLLSGAPHTATVRAAEGAVVFEIGAHQHVPLRSNRPAFADGLQALVEERRRQQRARAAG